MCRGGNMSGNRWTTGTNSPSQNIRRSVVGVSTSGDGEPFSHRQLQMSGRPNPTSRIHFRSQRVGYKPQRRIIFVFCHFIYLWAVIPRPRLLLLLLLLFIELLTLVVRHVRQQNIENITTEFVSTASALFSYLYDY